MLEDDLQGMEALIFIAIGAIDSVHVSRQGPARSEGNRVDAPARVSQDRAHVVLANRALLHDRELAVEQGRWKTLAPDVHAEMIGKL